MLNKSKGNMYDFITHTWNTIKGICPHGCTYCYMKKWGQQKPVRFDESELKTDLGTGNYIFVGSSCDMFASLIPGEWIIETITRCLAYPKNKYFFQSKDPSAFIGWGSHLAELDLSLCTTIETNRIYKEMGDTPKPGDRAVAMANIPIDSKYVTIEPIMDFDLKDLILMIRATGAKQVNIGADSGNNKLPEPPKEKILELITELEQFTIVKQKTNLKRLI
jgi:protein gp37